MLPFLKNKEKQSTGIQIQVRAPDEPEKSNENEPLEACAQDIINAIHNRDAKSLAEVLKYTFEMLDQEPHEEGPHINESEGEE